MKTSEIASLFFSGFLLGASVMGVVSKLREQPDSLAKMGRIVCHEDGTTYVAHIDITGKGLEGIPATEIGQRIADAVCRTKRI